MEINNEKDFNDAAHKALQLRQLQLEFENRKILLMIDETINLLNKIFNP